MDKLLDELLLNGNQPKPPKFSLQDVLAALGFEASRIVNSVSQHSAGAPFPEPTAIQAVIDRMNELNKTIIHYAGLMQKAEQDAASNVVKLGN